MPHRRRGFALAVAVVVLWTAAARADQVDDYITAQLAFFKLPGLSMAVIKDGAIVKVQGYGFADRERAVPATVDTIYRIGSISKQLIATGIMLLAQEGRLSVDDPLSKHLDGTPPSWQAITLRHLLSHTAGLVRESPAFDPMRPVTDIEILKATYPLPLQSPPGATWLYSNVGYYALAEVITRVAARPWPAFLHDRIFVSAGMTHTTVTNARPLPAARAVGYTGDDNANVAPEWLALRPSGAFMSTVGDLAQWDAAIDRHLLLPEPAQRRMWTRMPLNDGTTAAYGFGWHVTGLGGRDIVNHGGGQPGFSSHMVKFINDGVTVIVLTNGNDVDAAGIAARVALFYLPSQ